MEDRRKADAIVALDVAKPHPLSQLVVALMGLVVFTPQFCKFWRLHWIYDAAQPCHEGREVHWFSDAANMQHPDDIDTITRCM